MDHPVLYLLSNHFDYGRMISGAAGPPLARTMGWPSILLRDLVQDDAVLMIDNRITPADHDSVLHLIQRHPRRPVFVRLVDPWLENIVDEYYQFLLQIARYPNVLYVGPYKPSPFGRLLDSVAGRETYHFLPYCYDRSREQPISGSRCRRLFLAGALGAGYPDRWRIYMLTRRKLFARLFIHHLPHPDYPDLGREFKHRVFGDAFVAAAAKYAAFWVDGGRGGIEFLKYSECALAGCAPVGVAADNLPPNAAAAIFPLPPQRELQALRRLLQLSSELERRAQDYREALARDRDPATWTNHLRSIWRNHVERLA